MEYLGGSSDYPTEWILNMLEFSELRPWGKEGPFVSLLEHLLGELLCWDKAGAKSYIDLWYLFDNQVTWDQLTATAGLWSRLNIKFFCFGNFFPFYLSFKL